MGSPNGGIIGVINPSSFGKDTLTSKTSSGCVSLQSGTRVVQTVIVAGGGGGGSDRAGGGGSGGLRNIELNAQGNVPVVIGSGGAGSTTFPASTRGTSGVASSFSGTTSAGGGAGVFAAGVAGVGGGVSTVATGSTED